jgi:membrane protease YdiL (CAAX protease family)
VDSVPPSSSSPKERPLTFVFAALWAIAAATLLQLGVVISEALRPGARHDLVTWAASYVIAYSFTLFAILRVHEPETRIREVLALKRPYLVVAVLALAAGAALAPISDYIEAAITARYPPPKEVSESIEKLLAVTTTGKRAALVGAMVVVIPICEELFLRGALFTPLARGRRVGTVVVATAAYEVLGVVQSPTAAASLLPAAILFAWLRGATGTVVPSVLARVAFYAVQFIPIAMGSELPRAPRNVLFASIAIVLVASSGVAFLHRRRAPAADE